MTPYFKVFLKVVVAIIGIALLMWATNVYAFNPYTDLKEGNIVRSGTCQMDGEQYPCVVIEKEKVKFLVVFDEAGVLEVHMIKNDQEKLMPNNLKKVWERPNNKNMV